MNMVICLDFLKLGPKIKKCHFELSTICVKSVIWLVKDYATLLCSFGLEISLAERRTYLYSKKIYITMSLCIEISHRVNTLSESKNAIYQSFLVNASGRQMLQSSQKLAET